MSVRPLRKLTHFRSIDRKGTPMNKLIALLVSLCLWTPQGSLAEAIPFDATLVITASVGTSPGAFQLLSTMTAGVAEISGGVVSLPSGKFSVVVPSVSGFGGNLVNGAATFSADGAGPGSSCPLVNLQEICIDGGGFGGVMPLDGATHLGQELVVWGEGGSNVASTTSGIVRSEEGTAWTQANAAAWYYIPEIDPTPFRIQEVGTFRGLPGTFTGTGQPGFSLVTPMTVTSNLPSSHSHVRAIARLTLDFNAPAVPIGGTVALAAALLVAGVVRLLMRRADAS